jgi:hypothetical protein
MPTFANFDAEKKTPMANSVALQTLPQRLTPSLPPLNGVTAVVSRCSPSVASLQHVLCLISDFLDFSGSWAIPRACARLGCLPLLRRLLQREKSANSPLDPYYRDWIFNRGVSKAAKGGDLDVVKWLMTEYSPRTVVTLGVEAAAAGGHLHVLEWLYECDVEHGTALFGQREMLFAAREGHLDVLQWLHDKCRVSPALQCVVSPAALLSYERWFERLQAAADNGHLKVVRWVAEETDRAIRSPHGDNASPAFHLLQLTRIAANGHLHVLEYLHGQAFVWLKLSPSPYTASAAVENGHFNILQWVMDHDLVDANSQLKCMVMVAARGDLHVLQWMHETKRINVDTKVVVEAAKNGHLHILKYLHEIVSDGEIFTVDAMNQAAANGHLEVVQWLHFNRTEGCTTVAMYAAAVHGHLEVVKWLHSNRTEGCNSIAMDRAAANGHLDVVQWLHVNRSEGCASFAFGGAAGNGHLEVVKWLHENRTERFGRFAVQAAAMNGHVHVLRWLHANRTEDCGPIAMDYAAERGHLDAIKWLHCNRTEGCTADAMDMAAARGHLDVVKWLHFHRNEGCTTLAMDAAARFGRFEVMLFLHENRSEGCSTKAFVNAVLVENLDMLHWLAANYPQYFEPSKLLLFLNHSKAAIAAWLKEACDQADAVEL